MRNLVRCNIRERICFIPSARSGCFGDLRAGIPAAQVPGILNCGGEDASIAVKRKCQQTGCVSFHDQSRQQISVRAALRDKFQTVQIRIQQGTEGINIGKDPFHDSFPEVISATCFPVEDPCHFLIGERFVYSGKVFAKPGKGPCNNIAGGLFQPLAYFRRRCIHITTLQRFFNIFFFSFMPVIADVFPAVSGKDKLSQTMPSVFEKQLPVETQLAVKG